jgi:hypothetical protein
MNEYSDPSPLAAALSELIARRGFARVEEHRQYHAAWQTVAAPHFAEHARISRVSRGQLIVEVDNGPLLSELSGFHTTELLKRLQTNYPQLKIKGLKFRLKGLA